jgi:hypothetical protein
MRIWSVKPVQLWFIIQFIGLNLVISLEAVPKAWWFLLLFYKETKLEASVRQSVVDIFCTPLGTEWQSKRPQFKCLGMVFLGFISTVTVRCIDTNRAHVSFYHMWAGVAQSVWWRATDWTARVRFPGRVQTDSGAHSASYLMGKVAWALSRPFSFIWCQGQE